MKTNDPNEKLTDPRRAEWSSGKEAMEIQCEHGADERGADSKRYAQVVARYADAS